MLSCVFVGSDKLIAIHRLEDGVLLSKVENEHLAGINQVDWLNDHILVSACDDGLIRIKNITEVSSKTDSA